MNYRTLLIDCGLVFAILACGGTDDAKTADTDEGRRVLAKMDGKVITESDFQAELARISPFAQNQFTGAEGRRRMLDRMLQNELLYRAAEEKGYRHSKSVREQLEEYERNLVIRAYYQNEIQGRVDVTEEEIRNYYNDHPDKYTEKARVKVRHILAATEDEARAIEQELRAGADFRKLAKEKSRDKLSSKREGLLGNIIQNGYIPTIGKDEEIQKILFSMSPGEISAPVRSKKGYHIFLVEDRTEARLKSIDEVRDLIVGELKRQKLNRALEDHVEKLKERYKVEIFDENVAGGKGSATGEFQFQLQDDQGSGTAEQSKRETQDTVTDLLARAAETEDPATALRLYREILARHPDDPSAYKAQFMVGFLLSEQLNDPKGAISAFRRVIERYPDCELVDSARYMIRELGGEETSAALRLVSNMG